MGEAPERIWLDWPDANRGDVVYAEPPERDTQPGQTGYVRADLHDATRARVRELEAGNRGLLRLNEETESRAEKAETRNKELVMKSLADLGQAQEAYEAQKKAEALSWRLRSYAVHDDDCTRNRHPHYRGCSCGLQKLLDSMEEQNRPETRISEQASEQSAGQSLWIP